MFFVYTKTLHPPLLIQFLHQLQQHLPFLSNLQHCKISGPIISYFQKDTQMNLYNRFIQY